VRRKNATRESTSTLKAWLYEHIKNPYPTKGEKIMLAIITKMTLTQVTTYPGQVAHTHVPLSPNTTKLHSDHASVVIAIRSIVVSLRSEVEHISVGSVYSQVRGR